VPFATGTTGVGSGVPVIVPVPVPVIPVPVPDPEGEPADTVEVGGGPALGAAELVEGAGAGAPGAAG
jgi:hypothetical protein